METSKQGFVEAPAPSSLVSARREDEMPGVQAPLQMVYLHTLYAQPPVGQDTQALPLLTLQVAGGMQLHHAGQVPPAAAPPAKSKTEGKHVCSYCGRDCRKPSVLQKHLRCHTGERPFPCTTCGVAFKTQSNLYKHKRTQAHARLSSDSEQESLSSQDSAQGSRASSWCESSASFGEGAATPNTTTASPSSPQALPRGTSKTGPDNEAASHQAGLLGLIVGPVEGNQEDQSFSESGSQLPEKDEKGKRAPQTQTRHLLLQRQEATFSKRWGSCTSSGKSQSHDSTDSGFSESTDLNWTTSPGSVLHDRSMESLKESSTEEHEDALTPATPRDACPNGSGTRSQVSEQEKKKLEERISKLISENNAVVDDKRLENVRPRKTMPSKQGSIDLPMPYTYKDSFHFEMKTGSNWQTAERKVKQALYNSVPTQGSASLEEGPLTRSSSLPFTACNLGLERSSHYPCCHREGTHQNMRCNTVQGDLLMRSVDQPSTHHRSLVRQKAVDWLPATESLLVTSSLEEDSSGTNDSELVDNAAESGIGKCRRRRSQKFSYNKWHMYGGSGTFTKLYNFEKSSDRDLSKIKKPLQREEKGRGPDIQKRDMALFKEHGKPVMSSQDALKADATEANVQPTFDQPPLLSSVSNNATAELANFTPSNTFLHKRALQKSHSESDSAAKLSTEVPVQGVNELPSDRKKQRTSYCALPVQVDTSVGSSLGLVTGPAMLRDNERLHHPAEFYGEESPDDQLDFTVSSTNHNQDQKSRSSLSFKEQHAPARSSFLPKYQLKLPQTDSMSNSSTLQVGDKGATDDFTVSIAKPTVTFHSAEGHTAPRQGSSAEIHPSIYGPVTTHMSPSAQRQSMPPTPRLDDSIALKSGSDSVLPPTATLTFSVPPASVLPEMGNDFPEYKGEIMLLNETSHSSADNGRFGKNNTKILQIFVQFIPEEQLPFVEPPLNSQEPAQDVSQEEDETINLSHQGLKTQPRIDQHGDCTHSGSLSVSVTDCTNTSGQIEGVPQEVQMQDGAVSPDCRGGLLEEHSLRTCGEMVDAPVETSSVETSSVETSSVETTSGEAERTWLQIETAEGSPRVAPCNNTAGLKPLTKDKLVPQHHQEESCPKMQNQFEETGTRESHGGHHQVVSAAIQETPNPVAAPQQITDDSKRTPTHTHHPKHLFRCKLRHPAAQLHNTKFLKYRNRIKKPGQIHQSTKSEGWTDACDTPAPNLHYQHCSSATCPASSDPPEYQSGVQPSPMKQQMYAVNATSNEPSDHLQAIPSLFPKESHCSLVSVTTSCATGLTSQAGPAAVDTLSGTPTNMEVALLQLLSQQTLGANLSPSPCSAADVRSQTTSHDSGGRQLLNEGGGCSMDELVTRSVCRVTTRDEKPRDLLPSGLVVSTQGCKTTHGLVRQKALAPSLLHSGEMHQPTAPTSEGSSDEAQSKVAGFATVPPPSSAQCDPVVSSSCSSPGQAMDVSHRPDPPVSLPDLYHGAAGEKSTVDGKPLPTSPCQQDSKSNDMSAGSSVQEAQGCGPGGTAGPRVKVNAHAGETTQNPVTTSPGTGDERAEPASGRSQRGSALLLPGVGASATPNSDVWKPAECGLPACPVNVSVPALCGPTGPEDESVTAGKRREEEEEEEEEEAESSSSDDEGKLVIEL